MENTTEVENKSQDIGNVFSNLYPIVESDVDGSKHWDIFIYDEVKHPTEFMEMIHVLNTAKEGDSVTMHLNTPGGYLDSAIAIVGALNTTMASTHVKISGTVASAGTMIALACDTMELAVGSTFMIHYFSCGYFGKGNELITQAVYGDTNTTELYHEYYKYFLSTEEIDDVIRGSDIYLTAVQTAERFTELSIKRAEQQEEYLKNQAQEELNARIAEAKKLLDEHSKTSPDEDGDARC